MNRTYRLAGLAVAALLSACTATTGPKTSAQLTYETSPEGASLFEKGQAIGVAPVTRTYVLEAGKETITTPEVTAVWPSGAKTGFWTYLKPGADEQAVIERPVKAPGLDQDLAHAQKFINAKEQEARRLKEEQRREQARSSARCKEQQQSGKGAPISDC